MTEALTNRSKNFNDGNPVPEL